MRLSCRVDIAVPHEVHKQIISLGPSCFITTNYDQLLEQSFSKWEPDKHLRVVTNSQLTETANIIQAKSSNFIFKPHGDINDSESLILSREHYRKLSGEKLHVLKALETILASRPVIFLGFGLRDLDFLYLKDLLANIYKGGTIDHYAIMADLTDQELTYWRKNFGIHILSYTTIETGFEHQPLLDILQELNKKINKTVENPTQIEEASSGFTPDKILAIARYAANIIHSTTIQEESHVPLRISYKEKGNPANNISYPRAFDHSEVERFLSEFPQNALLVGNPGSGKSYSLRRTLYKLAQKLQDYCLQKEFDGANLFFPIYLDLKLYEGDIFEMINRILPPDFSLEQLSRFKNIRFYLDSYNELPNVYIDNRKFQEDLEKLLIQFDGSTTIIASRFAEGLSSLNYPIYQIENIDYGFIENQLKRTSFQLPDRFYEEIINLLQKPLFYRLYEEGKIALTSSMTPIDVYKSFIERLSFELSKAIQFDASLENLLKSLAYQMLSDGVETFAFDNLESILIDYFEKNSSVGIKPLDIINWLISRDFLVPAPKERLSFFHQSLTEYLAAISLSEKYTETPSVLDEIIKFTRWDQSLFLTLGFLDGEHTKEFIQTIINTDLALAIRTAKYLEYDRDEIVLQILSLVFNQSAKSHSFTDRKFRALTDLPVTMRHSDILFQLVEQGHACGGAACKLLIGLQGIDIKEIILKKLFENPADFDFCYDACVALSKILDIEDFQLMLKEVGKIEIDDSESGELMGLSQGMEIIAQELDQAQLFNVFVPWRGFNPLQIDFACSILMHLDSDETLALCIDMAISGIKQAIFSTHIRLAYPKHGTSINWLLVNPELIEVLTGALHAGEDDGWALECIRNVLENRKDFEKTIRDLANQSSGIIRIALLSCDLENQNLLLNEVSKIANLELENEPLILLRHIKLDWAGNESILIELLKIGNLDLAFHLLEQITMSTMWQQTKPLNITVEPISWWLSWMNSIAIKVNEVKSAWWVLDRTGILLTRYMSKSDQELVIKEGS